MVTDSERSDAGRKPNPENCPKTPVGFDLTGFRYDYNKSAEGNLRAMREANRKAYGRYPEVDEGPK